MSVGLVAQAIARGLRRAISAGTVAACAETRRKRLRRLADEQGALRRVATLVAEGAPPPQIFDAVAGEMGTLLAPDHIYIVVRHEPDETATVVGRWRRPGAPGIGLPLKGRWVIEPGTPEEVLVRTGEPVRSADYPPAWTEIGAWARERGLRHLVLCPITVEGHLWGLAANCSTKPQPRGTQTRMLGFVELVGTAIANAHGHAELVASRARLVAASDAARRRIERDLHDGAQQRLITLGLMARAAETGVPPGQDQLKKQLDAMAQGLTDVLDDLREICRGLHPAILSRNGLQAALKSVTRCLPIPVELDMRLDTRLDEPLEVAVYYVVSEALANTLKHAQATGVHVGVRVQDDAVKVSVRDDGIGGADLGKSGFSGLRDRIEALGGCIRIQSPIGQGTLLHAEIPLHGAGAPGR